MSVAPSYAKYEINGSPFTENGKLYVNIITPKGLKKVRWYPEKGEKTLFFSQKRAFGFDRGKYLTIIRGDEELFENWKSELPEWTIWHNIWFGYFICADINIELTCPEGIDVRKVTWEEIHDPNDKSDNFLRDGKWLIQYIDNLFK